MWPYLLPWFSKTTPHYTESVFYDCEQSLGRGKSSRLARRAPAWRPTLLGAGGNRGCLEQRSWESHFRAYPDSAPPACEHRDPTPAGEDGGGAEAGGGACPGAGRGRPGKTEAPSLGVAAEPGFRITTFSGAGLLETAGGKTRRPEAFAFFDARARDAAAVGRAPGKERPQTEPSESLGPPPPAASGSLSPSRRPPRGHGVSAPQLQRLHRSGLSQVPQRLPVVLVLQR